MSIAHDKHTPGKRKSLRYLVGFFSFFDSDDDVFIQEIIKYMKQIDCLNEIRAA